jgi:hypothetical protein
MTQNSARSRSDVVSQRDVIHIRRINSPDQTFPESNCHQQRGGPSVGERTIDYPAGASRVYQAGGCVPPPLIEATHERDSCDY